MLFLIILFSIACSEWLKMTKKIENKVFGIIFLLLSFYSVFLIREKSLLDFLIVLTICIMTDIGGYVFGKIFKGPKLIKISPNKTYAGMIGGYFLSLISLTVITNLIDHSHTPTQFFLLTLLISTVSQIGDIIVSYFKRLSKTKDTGKIIPGHGGLLDRIDGMIFAFPIVYLINLTGYLNVWEKKLLY